MNRWHGCTRRYKDHRTWKQRIQRLHDAWTPLLDDLTDAYIRWKYGLEVSTTVNEEYSFTINVVNLHTLATEQQISRDENTKAAVALVHAGYLGTAPEQPSLAISLQTLELFHTLRLFKPSFSVEAFAKTVCHTYSIPYRRTHRTALSDAFDIYLAIQRNVEKRVAAELGQDSPNWRVLNSCPACCYELEDEPPLQFSRMWVADGNNSLKRIIGFGNRNFVDTRLYEDGDYYLSNDFVNIYANEVKSRPSERIPDDDGEGEDLWEDESNITQNGDPTDGAAEGEGIKQCTDNWKAAASDNQKRMWNIFDETGVFVSACRHGFILWICDMIRSGELAKYPLAMTAMALKVFGPKWLMGYDIGCSFGGTIINSSLGPEFKKQDCRTCVNAFHGYSHNAICQLSNHPLNIAGMGLEDLETLERLFSASNQLASLTRYMTPYRRRIFIVMFLRQWDTDKYQNLATMLHNNYIQATEILDNEGKALEADLAVKGLTVEDLEEYFKDEAAHMKEMGKEAEHDVHAVAYVELLQRYREVNAACDNAFTDFRSHTPGDYQFLSAAASYNQNLSDTRKAETKRKFLCEKRDKLLFEVLQMEEAMGIPVRWQTTDKEYLETLQYIQSQKYQRALERVYKLVVMRLSELHKMNLSFTGYKMRTHISAALQRRSVAIRNAVKSYNAAAAAIGRPTLDWSQVTHYSFLDQLNILQDTRHSVLSKPWADPVVRHLMKQHRRVLRAREEIIRCNVEIRRLHTSIVDEEKRFDGILERLQGTPIFHPVSSHIHRRRGINSLLLSRIRQTQALPGFSGEKSPGKRQGLATDPTPPETRSLPDPDSDDGGTDGEDDEESERLNALIDVVSNLTV
ncbi:hypothetical protein C8R42DRAFT_595980 [Lentinula raphanica]|nr:hypothetical protein C8R42DRAFT_595980 [Lentinula raphanica]